MLPSIAACQDLLTALAPSGFALALHIRYAMPSVVIHTYDDAWIARYTAQVYQLQDPVAIWGLSRTGRIRWSELDLPDPAGILAEAATFGLRHGAAIACGTPRSRSLGGFARPDREFTDDELVALEETVIRMHTLAAPEGALTAAQAEALRLLAEGERGARLAARLDISESALRGRLAAARRRLGARTTAEAVTRAGQFGLL